jgi:hypothetical protein
MPQRGFEPTISASERPHIHVLDRAVPGTGCCVSVKPSFNLHISAVYLCNCMCVYVCMYICMYKYICMYVCVCVCMYACMYVYMYVFFYFFFLFIYGLLLAPLRLYNGNTTSIVLNGYSCYSYCIR